MKCIHMCALFILTVAGTVAADINYKQEIEALAEQVQILKTLHLADVTRLKTEIDQLKKSHVEVTTNNHERNEQATLQWAKSSMQELRLEMRELSHSVNNSALLRQLHAIRNELKQALMETSDLTQLARTQEARVDKLDGEVGRLKYEGQQMRIMIAELRSHIGKLSKEVKAKQMDELNPESYNEVYEGHDKQEDAKGGSHRLRHNKMVHAQISRLARSQDQLDQYQQGLQTQLLDVQRRLDRFEEPNWNLLSAKLEFIELQNKVFRDEIQNITQKVSDFDKVHASMLELREDVESVENKVDKTIPDFRKEISKLDINFAKLNAQSSYLKDDQENLRQSVKAIAVSISNAIDRADLDRLMLQRINDSIADLETRSKQHFYRLNDHILKSESVSESVNGSEVMGLSEVMGELQELVPAEREFAALVAQLPRDCAGVRGAGAVLLRGSAATAAAAAEPRRAWCDNGTTLLQRRYNGSLEFNRKFKEYVNGFGDPSSEYWLGLEPMHQITADNCSSMRIDMTDIYGGNWYAQYEHFSVGSADTGYVLEVSGFKGNASDAFEYQNHMEFSAIDRDRDISNTHCAGNYEGGWWFSHCQHVNINGKYTLGLTWFDSARNEWIAVATTNMRIYRRPNCS